MPLVESVVCSVSDAVAAERCGAGRLELCSTIELGGLTPSLGLCRAVLDSVHVPVMAMVRPRAGRFCYTESEIDTMVRDIEALVATGVQGVVFGALDSGGKVDISANSRLIAAAGRAETIFHRAIDTTPDPLEALAAIIALGFTRVLTSGGAPDAVAGAVALRRMYELADGRIELMPGGGMRPHNLAEFLRQVPADQIHLGPFRRVGQHSGAYGNGYMVLDEDVLAETIHCARNLESQPW